MTSQHSFRPGARIGALALAFGVVSGAFALTAAPAFAETTPTGTPTETASTTPATTDPAESTPATTDPATTTPAATPTEEAPVEATVSTDKANYAVTDTVLYAGTGWLPGTPVTVVVEGPFSGSFESEVSEEGTISGEINIVEYDSAGNPTGVTSVWTEGSYTLTVTQNQPDEAEDGAGDEGEKAVVSASTTFTVGDATSTTPASTNAPRELAETGAEDVFGIAGLGLLVAGAGAAALVGRRFLAKKA